MFYHVKSNLYDTLNYIVSGNAVEGKRFKHQNVVMAKRMEIFLYFLRQQKCARTVSLFFSATQRI